MAGLAMAYLVTMAVLVVVTVAPVALGWRPHLAISGSMQPMFGPGDLVLVAPAEPGRFYQAPGVITYRQSNGTVTHRVVDARAEGGGASYATKGDANRVADSSRVDHADVVGAVRLVVPLVGRPVLWARHQEWLPLTVWLASIVAALSALDPERLLARRTTAPGTQAAQAGR